MPKKIEVEEEFVWAIPAKLLFLNIERKKRIEAQWKYSHDKITPSLFFQHPCLSCCAAFNDVGEPYHVDVDMCKGLL